MTILMIMMIMTVMMTIIMIMTRLAGVRPRTTCATPPLDAFANQGFKVATQALLGSQNDDDVNFRKGRYVHPTTF